MTRRRVRGFTLIELIIFVVVVGVGVAGILSIFTTSIQSSADPLVRKQALAIAESLLEEILLKEYCDPDTVNQSTVPPTCGVHTTEGSRALYDDVDDYSGYTTASIVDATGTAVPGLGGYSISPAVSVTTAVVNSITMKKVVVQVTDTQNNVISLTGYRGNF